MSKWDERIMSLALLICAVGLLLAVGGLWYNVLMGVR